jgi:CBS domain containing-hemolysin-like protein
VQNVLEELVGDIRDEFDSDQPEVRKIGDGEYVVDGAMSLHDFSQMFDVQSLPREVVTVSGYVIQLLGRVPEKGATFGFGRWTGVVESMDRKRVTSLRLKAVQAANAVVQEQKP